jgi:iron(III) transport system substrate-binding protein
VTVEAIVAGFTKKYGVKVDAVRLSSAPVTQRISTEIRTDNVNVDVFTHGDATFVESGAKDGWWAALKTDELPDLAAWPHDFVKDSYVNVSVGPLGGVAYNTSLVKSDPPCTWDALLDPKWKGQIILTNPATTAAYTHFFDVVLHSPGLGEDWLTKFKSQISTVAESSVPASQMLAAGEGKISVIGLIPPMQPLIDKGAPLAFCALDNPAPAFRTFAAVVDKAKHPNAARLFMDYLLSKEGQTIYAKKSNAASPLGRLPGAVEMPANLVIEPPDQVARDLPKIQSLLGLS